MLTLDFDFKSKANGLHLRGIIQDYHNSLIALLAANPAMLAVTLKPINLKIELSNRMRSNAGTAIWDKGLISLNYRLLKDKPDELKATYAHELAHVIAGHIEQRRAGHGVTWRRVMHILGQLPKRCHKLDVSSIVKTFEYKCACREYKLKIVRHNRIKRGAKYHCVKCQTYLQAV